MVCRQELLILHTWLPLKNFKTLILNFETNVSDKSFIEEQRFEAISWPHYQAQITNIDNFTVKIV